MKKLTGVLFVVFVLLFSTNQGIAQDVIVLRNGDEIKAKILEIKQIEITYKNWANIDGPTYTKSKAEIFMIKYSNGTKDVFEVDKTTAGTFSNTTSKQFIGTWYDKRYNGTSNRSMIIITPAGENFLVDCKILVKVDEYFYDKAGSFKEVGHIENGSIVIDLNTKLSLLNDNTLLMRGKEYVKKLTTNESVTKKESAEKNDVIIEPVYTGEYMDKLKHGIGKLTFSNGSYYEGEWANDSINGKGSYTYFEGEKPDKWTTTGFWKNGQLIQDSLITKYWDDEIFEKGFFKEGNLWNGIRQTRLSSSSWSTHRFIIEIYVNGVLKKSFDNVKKEKSVTDENWLTIFNKLSLK